jgi:hypothetical protein
MTKTKKNVNEQKEEESSPNSQQAQQETTGKAKAKPKLVSATTPDEQSSEREGAVSNDKGHENPVVKPTHAAKKSKAKAKTPNRRAPTKKPTIRKVPVATYDSKSKILSLARKANVEGEGMTTDPVEIDLSDLSEDECQLAVSIAKVAINYAKGHDPDTKQEPAKGSSKGRSLIDKLFNVIERLKLYHSTAKAEDEAKSSKK